ncbi:hypothetical protein Dimus_007255 [Dionaea muscipula]
MSLVETALALGGTPRQATHQQVKRALVMDLSPVLDNTKTVVSGPNLASWCDDGPHNGRHVAFRSRPAPDRRDEHANRCISTHLCWPAFFTKAYQLETKVFSKD